MSERAVVVGGGAVGTACAHFLSLIGFDVTVVDRGDVGRGCSYANAGLIVPSHPHPTPGPGVVREGLSYLTRRDSPFWIRFPPGPELSRWIAAFMRSCGEEQHRRGTQALLSLSRASLELFADLDADFSFARGPVLHVYVKEGWEERAEEEARDFRELGFSASVLDGDALREREPAIGPGVLGGIAIEGQAWGDSFALCRSLTAGFDVLEGRAVRELIVDGGRAEGIVFEDEEELDADLVVLATGAWTPPLAQQLGLRVPIQPAKGYSCTAPAPSRSPRVPVMAEELRVAIAPIGDRLRVGGTLELGGFRQGIDRRRYEAVLHAADEVLAEPFPREGEAWYGYRPLTPDDLPLIGPVPGVDGVLVAAGHGTLGFTQSMATGKLVAELATGAEPSVPPEPFRPDRF